MEKKTTESTIVKFYNYFMNSPKFKRAERFSWLQEPFTSFPLLYLIILLGVCIFVLIISLNGKNIGDEKYLGITFSMSLVGVMFLSMIANLIKIIFVDSVTDIGSYDDVIKLKSELKFLIKSILCKRTTNDDKFHFSFVDYKRLILQYSHH